MEVTALQILCALIALLHIWFLILEMYFWTKPLGLKTFRQSPEKAENSKILAANQGLYNGFLAAGLLYGLATDQTDFLSFFLICILAAGLYGGYSVNRRIALIQGFPAALALALIFLT